MDGETRRSLDRINRLFYDRHAEEFSARRTRPWRGWSPLLDSLERPPRGEPLRVLDAGCGNGRFAPLMANWGVAGNHELHYLGLDRSLPLLAVARAACRGLPGLYRFAVCDLIEAMPLVTAADHWQAVALFGVMHHVPAFATRHALLRALVDLLAPRGYLLLSLWCFDRDSRLMGRRISPEELGCDQHFAAFPRIDPQQLEPGDSLLRWGSGPNAGVRYCHLVDTTELERLLEQLPVEITADLEDDGREGTLNRYLALRKRAPS